jgi:hypothetical protein
MVRDEFLGVNTEKYIGAIFSFCAVAGKQFRRGYSPKTSICLSSNKPPGPRKIKSEARTTKVADQG